MPAAVFNAALRESFAAVKTGTSIYSQLITAAPARDQRSCSTGSAGRARQGAEPASWPGWGDPITQLL